MNQLEKTSGEVSTGIEFLDGMLSGDLPRGQLSIIGGMSRHYGTSALTRQFLEANSKVNLEGIEEMKKPFNATEEDKLEDTIEKAAMLTLVNRHNQQVTFSKMLNGLKKRRPRATPSPLLNKLVATKR